MNRSPPNRLRTWTRAARPGVRRRRWPVPAALAATIVLAVAIGVRTPAPGPGPDAVDVPASSGVRPPVPVESLPASLPADPARDAVRPSRGDEARRRLETIEDLLREGDQAGARVHFYAFRERYPTHPIPEDLLSRLGM